MKIRKAQPQRQTLKRSALCLALAFTALGITHTSCVEPERLNTDTFPEKQLPDANEYILDIAMLTEWAGNINPKTETMKFFVVENSDNQKNIIYNITKDDVDKLPFDSQSLILSDDKLIFNLLDTDKQDLASKLNIPSKIECNLETPNMDDLTDDEKKVLSTYQSFELATCKVQLGGAQNLYNTWNTLKTESPNQIRVSSGDSFGVSADISSRFIDLPTPLVLNALGLHIDTFGNHNFDKDLEYLRRIISWSNYQYLATNLTNVPKNLNATKSDVANVDDLINPINVAPRAIVEIPSVSGSKNPMRVAFVSALDMQATESVFPGKFGTLGVGDYCSLIQSIEDAYNEGSRAFFILGHIGINQDSFKAMLNALFYFSDQKYNCFSKDCIDNNDNNDNNTKSSCPSVLEISPTIFQKELKRYFNENLDGINGLKADDFVVNSVGSINFELKVDDSNKTIEIINELEKASRTQQLNINDEHIAKLINTLRINVYKDMIRNIHEEIFNGIIGILGEGGDPLMLPFHISNDDSNDHNFDSYLNKNKLLLENNCFNSSASQAILEPIDVSCYDLSFSPDEELENHPIWFIQIPANGTHTAQLKVQIKSRDNDSKASNHHKYESQILGFSYTPLIQNDLTTEESESLTVGACTQYLNDFDIDACTQYFNESIKNTQSITKEYEFDNETLNQCFIDIYSVIPSSNLNKMLNSLNCIYKASAELTCCETGSSCKQMDKTFEEPLLFDFKLNWGLGYSKETEENNDRSRSTFRTSLAADSILYYLNKKQTENGKKSDFAFINTGGLKQSVSPFQISSSILSEYAPYDNRVVRVLITPEQFVNLAEHGLTQTYDGGYPAFAGIRISEDPITNEIQEAWLVDRKGKFKELLYLKLTTNNDSNTITTAACNDKCVLGKYTISENTYKLEKKSDIFFDTTDDSLTLDVKETTCKNTKLNTEIPCLIGKNEFYEMLTLDYLTTGGDKYTFTDIDVRETVSDMQIKDYIYDYLSSEENNDVQETSCSKIRETPISTKSLDGFNTNDLICLTMLNRHFIINENDDYHFYNKDHEHLDRNDSLKQCN